MDELTRKLQAAREREAATREAATREILRVISRSPGDYGPVFQTILENAIRLCGAPFGTLLLVRGEVLDVVADTGLGPELTEFFRANPHRLDRPESLIARTVREQAPQQHADSDEEASHSTNPMRIAARELGGIRTLLGVPIIIGEETIGVIALWRQEVKPFADDDIELVSTFAEQAAIAIENVRQFQALEARTAELAKTLEQQTASSDILRSINRSRADFNPVFQTILSHAVRLCGAPFGGLFLLRDGYLHIAAHVGVRPGLLEKIQANPLALDQPHNLLCQAARAREPQQIVDLLDEVNSSQDSRRVSSQDEGGTRTLLGVPILQGDELLGVIGLFRKEVKAFADDEIELVRTFADQAAIAIENVHQFQAVQSRTADLTKSLERQTATSEILRSISQSPTDYAPIFDTILANAVRLCGAPFGTLFLLRDGHLHVVADAGSEPAMVEHLRTHPMPLDETSSVLVRAVIARAPLQQDLMDEAYHAGDPRRLVAVDRFGCRTWLGVPLLKSGEVIGAIALYRKVAEPFADDDIALVSTFADQAVIAIENVRLFQALETRTTDLTQSLERQTATSEILRSISQSPTDYAPVFQAVLDNAIRLCGAPFAILYLIQDDHLHMVAHIGARPELVEYLSSNARPLNSAVSGGLLDRTLSGRVPVQADDLSHDYASLRGSTAAKLGGIRTLLFVPMLKSDEVLGVIALYRQEVKPFADDDIELVRTFADQAVIAIENVRLFQALETRTTSLSQSLERQTATSEILRSISASPTDYDPVFDTILENATRLCGAPLGILYLLRDGQLQLVADAGSRPEFIERLRENPRSLDDLFALSSRTAKTQETIQIEDLIEEAQHVDDPSRLAGLELGRVRTAIGVPMLKGRETVGVIALYRQEVKPFADDDIELVRTFADQAVIAIENVRQFQVVQERTADLTKSLERQTATSEILRSISQSPTDYTPIFDTILDNATRLCGAPTGTLFLLHGDHLHVVADSGSQPEFIEYMRNNPYRLDHPAGLVPRVARARAPIQIEDFIGEAYASGDPVRVATVEIGGVRTAFAVPLLKSGDTVGVIVLHRREVKPFASGDIALVSTFADQAVIAIENVRLFQALESRNSALGESLERQTATSEILRSISRSPTDYQPVFDTILESATHLCDAPLGQLYLVRDGGIHLVANRGSRPEFLQFSRDNVRPVNRTSGSIAKAFSERRPVYAEDATKETLYSDGDKWRVAGVELEGIRSVMTVPLLKGEEAIGVIVLYRREVQQFEERHVSLLETFADQAVIAIENVRLFQALEGRTADLTKTLERQTATSEILRSISQSPTDYAPVFQTILDNAIRLCGAPFGMLFLLRDGHLHVVADVGARPEFVAYLRDNPWPMDHPSAVLSQAARGRVPSQNTDQMDETYRSGDPLRAAAVELGGIRTLLGVPMLKGGETVGVIALYRQEVNTFEDDDIELVTTFADQAVIAIENVRLFQALEGRTADLTKSLERQTATSEILRSISQSPTGYGPVFDTILKNASRLCDVQFSGLFLLRDDHLHLDASLGGGKEFADFYQANPVPLNTPDSVSVLARCARERIVHHDIDIRNSDSYRSGDKLRVAAVDLGDIRTLLMVPLFRGEETLGVLALFRQEVRAFGDDEIGLVRTFADQAVIAIENVNLFNETNEALERQTATADILKVISSSPTDVQPVFDAIAKSAQKLCDGTICGVFRFDGKQIQFVAHHGWTPEGLEVYRQAYPLTPAEDKLLGRVLLERRVANVADILTQFRAPIGQAEHGHRSCLAVPMLRNGVAIGAITVGRRAPGLFLDRQVELLKTFADQAVIAIENVSLFQTLEARTTELTRTLERQTATSEILRSISESPTDSTSVFDTILENVTRLCEAPLGVLFLREGDHLQSVASIGARTAWADFLATHPVALDELTAPGQAVRKRRPVQIEDILIALKGDAGASAPARVASVELEGIRTFLAVPMLRDGQVIGVIAIYRREVRAFDPSQIELVETFADQAVIAIENVRQFQQVQTRTAELTQSLERQTATSEILRSISRSPTDYAPVFDTILENAVRLCGAPFGILFLLRGDRLHAVADVGSRPEYLEYLRANPAPLNDPVLLASLAARERTPVQLADLLDEAHRSVSPMRIATVKLGGVRTMLSVPMLKGEETVGVIALYRREVDPFADDDIELVTTFADQAVIAIENVRLFQALEGRTTELTKTLERQTATSEILRSISSSPTDYAPVFDTILDNATRLCEAPLGLLFLRRNGHLQNVASIGAQPAFVEFLATYQLPIGEQTAVGQAALQKKAVQVEDTREALQTGASSPARIATVELEGARTFLAVPMLRDEQVVGVIGIYRREVRRFDDSMIELLETFADQAVIAIENVRLFQTVESRSSELAQSVAELEALGDIAQAVSSSLDVDTVLDTIVTRAVQLSRADAGAINEFDEATGTLPFRAAPGMEHMLEQPAPRLGEGAVGRAAATRAPVQIADITAPGAYTSRLTDSLAHLRIRALLAVPMMQNDQVLGALVVARRTPGEFPPEAVRLLRALGTQSAIAIRNARLFREIEDKGRELEAANRHKSEFLANMSHELRTPLNAVIGFSEVLGERMFGELNDKQAEYVTDIHDSGRHLLSLINDILDLSKVEAGAMELDLGRFALAPALDNALTLVRERAERRGIKLQASLDDELGEMEGDERKLKQILLNLLSNAIKFTGEGGSVTLEARQDDAHVHIAVRDTGVGISEEDLAVIFEEFKQVGTDYARKVEGTGLGLTLTKRFVEMHGGHITVTSEPGEGSVFTAVLPLRPVEQTT